MAYLNLHADDDDDNDDDAMSIYICRREPRQYVRTYTIYIRIKTIKTTCI